MMDLALRCNSVNCRSQLTDQAIVTTCGHLFCTGCLPRDSVQGDRLCPACESRLSNPHDVFLIELHPSEEYKSCLLSGLSPSIIMECASRGLAFYNYQIAQEVMYQEFLAKSLKEKQATISTQMDQVIHDANAEIVKLRNKVLALETEQNSLQQKHHDLKEAFKEKLESCRRAQAKYDDLRRRMLHNDVQTAAINAAEHSLQSPNAAFRQQPNLQNSARKPFRSNIHTGRGSNGSDGSDGQSRLHTYIPRSTTWRNSSSGTASTVENQLHNGNHLPVPSRQLGPMPIFSDIRNAPESSLAHPVSQRAASRLLLERNLEHNSKRNFQNQKHSPGLHAC